MSCGCPTRNELDQIQTPPDSDAREVCGATFTRDGKLLVCQDSPHHDPDHAMQVADRRRLGGRLVYALSVSILLRLAHRILAALERHSENDHCPECRALVAELRERMPK